MIALGGTLPNRVSSTPAILKHFGQRIQINIQSMTLPNPFSFQANLYDGEYKNKKRRRAIEHRPTQDM